MIVVARGFELETSNIEAVADPLGHRQLHCFGGGDSGSSSGSGGSGGFFDSISAAISSAVSAIGGTIGSIADTITAALGHVVNGAAAVVGAGLDLIGDVFQTVGGLAGSAPTPRTTPPRRRRWTSAWEPSLPPAETRRATCSRASRT